MILLILGLYDIVVAILLLLMTTFSFTGNGIVNAVAIISLIKGLWSLLSSIFSGYFYDWMGAADTIAGVVLFLATRGNVISVLHLFWIVMVIKGLASIASGFR